jgi:hypothetical protein
LDGKLKHDTTHVSEINQEHVSKEKEKHDTNHVSKVRQEHHHENPSFFTVETSCFTNKPCFQSKGTYVNNTT